MGLIQSLIIRIFEVDIANGKISYISCTLSKIFSEFESYLMLFQNLGSGAKTDSQSSGSWSNSSPAAGAGSPTWAAAPGQASSFQPTPTNGAIGAGPQKNISPPSPYMGQGIYKSIG